MAARLVLGQSISSILSSSGDSFSSLVPDMAFTDIIDIDKGTSVQGGRISTSVETGDVQMIPYATLTLCLNTFLVFRLNLLFCSRFGPWARVEYVIG